MINAILSIFIVVFGVCFGLYAGIWWAFIGGITDIIDGIKATPAQSMMIAVGFAKLFFSGFIGWASGILIVGTGIKMMR